MRARYLHRWLVALTLLALALSTPLAAHEIGTTRVTVDLHEGRYAVEIVTDAASLLEKLKAISGEDRPSLASYDDIFRGRVQLRFDGQPVHPDVQYSVAASTDIASPPIATIRASGIVPGGAHALTWSYGWTFASYALTTRGERSTASTVWLEGGQASAPIALDAPAAPLNRLSIGWRYLTLGFTHIVPYGFDHVLFVLGIFLLGGGLRSILWQVSAFTVAHSITLGLSMFGLLTAPSAVVEPLIAVSILYVAVENLFLRELRSWRVALVFAFGLLHGLGFAGALKELGLPRSEFMTALLTFNLGVEGGQMAVIGMAFLLFGWHYGGRDWYRQRIVVPASLLIACTAVYWTIERLPRL